MPTTANRALRYPLATDTPDVPRDLGYLAADVDAQLASKRNYVLSVASASLANGASLGSIVIPAQAYACRVVIRILAAAGYAAATNQIVGVNIAASAGALNHVNQNTGIRCAESGQYYSLSDAGSVDLAAATACTLTFTIYIVGGSNAYFRGDITAEIRLAGEY